MQVVSELAGEDPSTLPCEQQREIVGFFNSSLAEPASKTLLSPETLAASFRTIAGVSSANEGGGDGNLCAEVKSAAVDAMQQLEANVGNALTEPGQVLLLQSPTGATLTARLDRPDELGQKIIRATENTNVMLPSSLKQLQLDPGESVLSLLSISSLETIGATTPTEATPLSPVVSFSLRARGCTGVERNLKVEGLPDDDGMLISLPLQEARKQDTQLECLWWDNDKKSWSKQGCQLVDSHSTQTVGCSCTHLTSFLVGEVKVHYNTALDELGYTGVVKGAIMDNGLFIMLIAMFWGLFFFILFGVYSTETARRKAYEVTEVQKEESPSGVVGPDEQDQNQTEQESLSCCKYLIQEHSLTAIWFHNLKDPISPLDLLLLIHTSMLQTITLSLVTFNPSKTEVSQQNVVLEMVLVALATLPLALLMFALKLMMRAVNKKRGTLKGQCHFVRKTLWVVLIVMSLGMSFLIILIGSRFQSQTLLKQWAGAMGLSFLLQFLVLAPARAGLVWYWKQRGHGSHGKKTSAEVSPTTNEPLKVFPTTNATRREPDTQHRHTFLVGAWAGKPDNMDEAEPSGDGRIQA